MSLRSLLMPALTERLLSRERLLRARARAERMRSWRGQAHRLSYFHQTDDPYSALMAQCLPLLLARYEIELHAQVVPPPEAAAAPDRARLVAYSRSDAQRLALHHGLAWRDPLAQPALPLVLQATARLVSAAEQGHFAEQSHAISSALWAGAAAAGPGAAAPAWPAGLSAPASPAHTQAHLAQAAQRRQRLGHYLGATLHYGGEWYWGIDRLHHLERRLQALGVQRAGVSGLMFDPGADLVQASALDGDVPAIDFYFSLRSPYSAIVAARVFDLARHTGAAVNLRYVLPMVMRGLPVPRAKRRYIAQDAAREAYERGIPFGRLNDPVGRPTERGLALMPLAERLGLGRDYVLSFMRGVWAEGLDAGGERGLRRIAERAGLNWRDSLSALADATWAERAEAHRAELLALGLWGVPSFKVRNLAVWGQDRLWAVQEELLRERRAAQVAR